MNTSLPPQFFNPSLSGTAAVPSAAGVTLAGEPATDTGFAAAFAQFLGQLPVSSPAAFPAASTASVSGAAPSTAPVLGSLPFAAFTDAKVSPEVSPLATFPSAPSARTAPAAPASVALLPTGAGHATSANPGVTVAAQAEPAAPDFRRSWNLPESATFPCPPASVTPDSGECPAPVATAAGFVPPEPIVSPATGGAPLSPLSPLSPLPTAPAPRVPAVSSGPVAGANNFSSSSNPANGCEPVTSAAVAVAHLSVAAPVVPMAAASSRPGVASPRTQVAAKPSTRPSSISEATNEPWVPVAVIPASQWRAVSVEGDSAGAAVASTLAPAELSALEASTGLDRASLENLLALLVPAVAIPAEQAPATPMGDAGPFGSSYAETAEATDAVATHAFSLPADFAPPPVVNPTVAPSHPAMPQLGGEAAARTAVGRSISEVVTSRDGTVADTPRAAVDESGRVQIAGLASDAVSAPVFVGAEVQAANGVRIALRPAAKGGVALELLPTANSAVGEDLPLTTVPEVTGAAKKMFLSDSRQSFAMEKAEAGIAVAQMPTDMPATFIAPAAPAAATSEWMASAAPVIEAIEVRQDLPADATGRAAAAVHAVVEVAEAQAASRLQSVPAVTLRFDFQGEPLSVRVEMRDGEVRTEFRTNSPELSSALAHEWRAVAVQSDAGPRLADPVFSSPSRPNDAGHTGGWDQQSSQNRASGQMPEQFAGARTVRAARSASTPVATTEAAPVAAGAVRPATSRRLSVLA